MLFRSTAITGKKPTSGPLRATKCGVKAASPRDQVLTPIPIWFPFASL